MHTNVLVSGNLGHSRHDHSVIDCVGFYYFYPFPLIYSYIFPSYLMDRTHVDVEVHNESSCTFTKTIKLFIFVHPSEERMVSWQQGKRIQDSSRGNVADVHCAVRYLCRGCGGRRWGRWGGFLYSDGFSFLLFLQRLQFVPLLSQILSSLLQLLLLRHRQLLHTHTQVYITIHVRHFDIINNASNEHYATPKKKPSGY